MRRSKFQSWPFAMSVIAQCCVCAALVIGCSDDEKDAVDDECPGDASVGRGCPDAAASAGESGGGAGSTAGRGGSSGSGTGGSSGSGGSDQPDDDAGMEPTDDGGMPGAQPPMDGSQLSACSENADCTEDRVCYTPGAQEAIGYCTAACSEDEDCAALGDAYTCNAMGGGGMGMGMGMSMGACRIECEGEDDTSCPDMMSCVETSPDSFRCAYVEEPDEPGSQDVALWQPCAANGDCVEGLICYPAIGGGGPGGGGGESIGGFCTQPCENGDDCTESEPSGDIEPSCGMSGGCRFECMEGDACPDGMECVEQGGSGRCLYPEQ